MATKKEFLQKRALVTCGPTWVAIDDVRVISNKSTGELGHLVVDHLVKEGVKVTLIEGPVTHLLKSKPAEIIKFQYFAELDKALTKELKKTYDIIIHAAAVSDYEPNNTYGSKISSAFVQIRLNLVPTPKIIDKIRRVAPRAFLVGFKLESRADKNALLRNTENLLKKADCSLVVANIQNGASYASYIIDDEKNILAENTTRPDTARSLVEILKEYA